MTGNTIHQPAAVQKTAHPVMRVMMALIGDRLALCGLIMLAIFVLLALLAPLLSPQNPYDLMQLDIMDGRLAPVRRAWRA